MSRCTRITAWLVVLLAGCGGDDGAAEMGTTGIEVEPLDCPCGAGGFDGMAIDLGLPCERVDEFPDPGDIVEQAMCNPSDGPCPASPCPFDSDEEPGPVYWACETLVQATRADAGDEERVEATIELMRDAVCTTKPN